MGASYYQFCPVAKAMELLDERWTLLIVRELVSGSERFNEIRRGLPRMSPTLLSKRLQQLVRAGIIEKHTMGVDTRYLLSPAGRELRPIVEALGVWGVRWIGEIGDAELDPKLLMWDMRRHVDPSAVSAERTVVHFRFTDAPAGSSAWWLIVDPQDADVCDIDPGHPADLVVTTRLRVMTEIWLGETSWERALGTGSLDVQGPTVLRRALPRLLTLSTFAAVPRPATPLRVGTG